MGKIKNTLETIALGSVLTFSTACSNLPPKYVSGQVIGEAGTIVDRQKIIERSGKLCGNDPVRFGDPTYAIQFIADDSEIYTIAIRPYSSGRLDALNKAIEWGTKIKIPKDKFNSHLKGKIGSIADEDLYVLEY